MRIVLIIALTQATTSSELPATAADVFNDRVIVIADGNTITVLDAATVQREHSH